MHYPSEECFLGVCDSETWRDEVCLQCFCISGLIFEMDPLLFLKNYCFIAPEESVAHV